MRKQELARLKSGWQFDLNGSFDRTRTSEANERFRFSEHKIAQRRKTCGDAAHGWIGKHRDVEPAQLVVSRQCSGHFRHLHQRQDAFVHSRAAARSADNDQWQRLRGSTFGQSREPLTDD